MTSKQPKNDRLAIWAITPRGAELAWKIAGEMENADVHLGEKLAAGERKAISFSRLSDAVSREFRVYGGHIFIMSAGIVVRMIAPHIRHKTEDPAVVVVDETGKHAISLLSGHIGGANALAELTARLTGARAVITTATDLNQAPAIDLLARENNLFIENPGAIKYISMALITGKKVLLHDPFNILRGAIGKEHIQPGSIQDAASGETPGVFIDDARMDLGPRVLVLRPGSLVAGIGCNRNTGMEEMKKLLLDTLEKHCLAPASLGLIASIDIKKDEPGLLSLADELAVPMVFFNKERLGRVKTIKTPSRMVEKHIGVKSVCEAAAILGAKNGELITIKHKTRNATAAIARKNFTS
ncbi:MAG: cobalt-precorrin 5A hydrolase [Desulfobacterales bacterium]|nr:cobalt-precorrin 5A hydrolase [Desulfobacterales bacterium]